MRNKVLVYVEAVFAIVYLGGGLFLLFGPNLLETRTFQTVFGIILLMYAGFRFYRTFKKMKQNDQNP